MRRTLGGYMLVITGLLACPCHVPLTLPLVLALLGGTALGGWLNTHMGLVYGLSAGYFLAALIVGFWWLNRPGRRSALSLAEEASCPFQTAPREHTTPMDERPQ